ncbi:hypothetical protein [Clostridium sp. ZS2-4]|uniref:hypothetical protein n=1 Tax=Clostridium sp. ZS2-4 TaxID=2987703 RepID=UPI00227D4B15|nr:hypothetical protein [Clostridium sp. ZS2-4]MCY6355224.1 hypothetical protein [Clostridium sp. ZS2-4]
MKRVRARTILVILFVVLVLAYVYIAFPRTYNKTFQGIKYRLGETNNQFTEKVTISINGKLSNDFIFGKKFVGKIKINDLEFPKENELKEIKLKFDKYNRSNIQYYFVNKAQTFSQVTYGPIYINDDFSQLTINIMEPQNLYIPNKKWIGDNGLMIAAPASNRKEALQISNSLMKYILSKELE